MKIRLLPEEIAARIAAGEVVERPASVVKELVENSLDAGATHVKVETQNSGKSLIRVLDNGEGILGDDLDVAFRRHATSKLETAEDLERIATLGFRGEALASIAAVSRVCCTTRNPQENAGTRIRIEGGKIVSRTAVGHPSGTEMVIEDLFYNVPARRKFLSSERSERRHIDAFLTRYAIAYPHVSFQVTHDGKESLATPGNNNPREVLLKVYGLDLGASLLEIPQGLTEGTPIQVRGFVGPTTVHRANRGYITIFINGRWIQDLRLTYAVIQAYHTLLPVKRFPIAFIIVDMPMAEVDVNVHPAKAEVRFQDPDTIFRAIQRTVRSTVIATAPAAAAWRPQTSALNAAAQLTDQKNNPTLHARLAGLKPAQQFTLPNAAVSSNESQPTEAMTLAQDTKTNIPTRIAALPTDNNASQSHLPPLRVVGQVATMFIVAEGPDGLYLIDQHAAHERVLYEQMLSDWAEGTVPAQPLLEPIPVTLPPDEAASLEEKLPLLSHLGLEVEPFGPNTFLVQAMPALLRELSAQDILADIASSDDDRSPIREGLEAITVRAICKRAAVKAGQVLSQEEMEHLIKALESSLNPRTCPHGRPTILQISVEQLAAQFERR